MERASPTTGTASIPALINTFTAMRVRTTLGTPRRALRAMRTTETNDETGAPRSGMSPMIGSRPKRMFVPGMTNAVHQPRDKCDQRVVVRAAFRRIFLEHLELHLAGRFRLGHGARLAGNAREHLGVR